ncbi:hypothetical protein [Taibaiella koreensis]|uniref:hypothetical protein n=1 Tax=Taibaiella koreensis TaxID=1268548 RepID=UPI000E5A0745|nr:hypothetical protein [Taibaiella koreensis]
MQKVVAVSVNINELASQPDKVTSLVELEGLNELLAEGWEIEDWSFLTDEPVNGRMPMLVILNDQLLPEGEGFYEEYEEELPEEEE